MAESTETDNAEAETGAASHERETSADSAQPSQADGDSDAADQDEANRDADAGSTEGEPAAGLSDDEIAVLAERMDQAARNAETVPMLTLESKFSESAGYAIQRASIRLRESRGDHIVGMKLGLTSRAKMKQVGVHEPIRGYLTREMWVDNDGWISSARHCHPRVEPEVAFVMGSDLRYPCSLAEAVEAVKSVHVALEVIDSRYENFEFTLPDVVADNCSSAHFVLGSHRSVSQLAEVADLTNLGVVFSVNGEVRHTASSAAVLGNPAQALVDLAAALRREGKQIPAGWVVLSGGATAAVHVQPGDVCEVDIEGLGTARLFVQP